MTDDLRAALEAALHEDPDDLSTHAAYADYLAGVVACRRGRYAAARSFFLRSAGDNEDGSGAEVRAAVRDGFLSVTDDRVSILASFGELATDIDLPSAHADLDAASAEAGAAAAEESVEVRYARARLRAAGDQA